MANTQGIVLKEGAVLVADAHADFNRREFLYFLRAVNCGEIAASQLIMMGDMFDFYAPQCDFAARFAKPYLSLISQIASKIPVIYIEGNHDFCLEKSAFDLAGFKGADYPCSKPKLCADGLESARLNAAFNRCAADYKSEKIASYEFCSALDSDSATSSDYELARFSNPLHANFNDNEPNSTENSNSATQSQSAALNLNCFKNSHHSTQNASASVLQADNLLSKISGGLSNLNLQDKSSGDELKNQAAFARLENAKQNNQSDLLSLNPQNEPASDAQSSKAALNKQEKPTPSQLKQGDLLNLGSQNNPRQNELQSTPKASQSHNLTPQSPLQNGIFIIPFSAQPLRLRTPFGASVALAHGDNHLPFFTQRALLFLRQRWLLRSLNFIDRHLRYKISRRLFKHLLRKRLDYKIENFSQIADEKMQKYSDEIVIEGHFHQGEIFKFKDRIYANVPSFACQCRYFVVKYADEKINFAQKSLKGH
ncbi:metallophosphoesterase [Campylobacter sp. 19-13652]|uniref:metallophosphoesterase n=1 Tax=Campylobacter sp. 19-13652 TaxID=2840180 RepID=UPI001C743DF4|nr:metallophosphoesterase [Campylobacter sp. 19-13652]BCX78807.1 hypothetical protein LBC_02690 [Campylobacter sp. 19-13652]